MTAEAHGRRLPSGGGALRHPTGERGGEASAAVAGVPVFAAAAGPPPAWVKRDLVQRAEYLTLQTQVCAELVEDFFRDVRRRSRGAGVKRAALLACLDDLDIRVAALWTRLNAFAECGDFAECGAFAAAAGGDGGCGGSPWRAANSTSRPMPAYAAPPQSRAPLSPSTAFAPEGGVVAIPPQPPSARRGGPLPPAEEPLLSEFDFLPPAAAVWPGGPSGGRPSGGPPAAPGPPFLPPGGLLAALPTVAGLFSSPPPAPPQGAFLSPPPPDVRTKRRGEGPGGGKAQPAAPTPPPSSSGAGSTLPLFLPGGGDKASPGGLLSPNTSSPEAEDLRHAALALEVELLAAQRKQQEREIERLTLALQRKEVRMTQLSETLDLERQLHRNVRGSASRSSHARDLDRRL